SAVGAFNSASLGNGDSAGPVSVIPGNYSVTENTKDGWDLSALSCDDSAQGDDDDSNVTLGTRTAEFDVQAGEDVICTFTNTERGSITITKATNPSDSTEEFGFSSAVG